MADECAVFLASLPPIMTAIKVSGDGGASIQLDVPDTHIADVLRLLLWRDTVLEVTVKPINLQSKKNQDGECDGQGRLASRSKWQPARAPAQVQGADNDLGASGGQDSNDQGSGR